MTAQRSYSAGESRALTAIAWAYPGITTHSNAALARRVGQVVRGFARAGWDVTVIYPDQTCLTKARLTIARDLLGDGCEVRLVGVSGPALRAAAHWSPFGVTRRLETLRQAAFNGDRSGQWAASAIHVISDHTVVPRPNLIVGFFTPRGPLALAAALHKQTGAPWLADLQDEALEGSGRSLRPVVSRWMSRTLASAAHVTQVSPEWALSDSAILNRPVEVLRHAVPVMHARRQRANGSDGDYVLLYAGSIAPAHQSPRPLIEAMARINAIARTNHGRRVVLDVAGPPATLSAFSSIASAHGIADSVRELGWLEPQALADRMRSASALVLVPWGAQDRKVIPSKLFDYAASATPILVAGPDSGALLSLFAEWGHDDVTCVSSAEIESALLRAINGDSGGLLRPNDATRVFGEEQLVARYCEWADALVVHGGKVYAAEAET